MTHKPTSLLSDIQESIVDSSIDLSTTLRKCKILAFRLEYKPLEDWIIHELDGYPADAEVPAYRHILHTVKGHFAGPFGRTYHNAPVPMILIPREVRAIATSHQNRQSVAELESLANSDPGTVIYDLMRISHLLHECVYTDMQCIQLWGEISVTKIAAIINSVRNRVLDFALNLEREFPAAGEASTQHALVNQDKIMQIFNTTVHGGSVNMVGSSSNSNVSQTIAPRDLNDLESQLREIGFDKEDIESLKAAIELDPDPDTKGKFGPKVAAWVGKVVTKAASGTYEFSVDFASSIVTKLLTQYYQ